MDVQVIVSQVFIIFAIMMIGYLTAKLGYVTREVRRGLTELMINVMIPATILVSFDTDLPGSALGNARVVLLYAVLAHVLTAVLGTLLFRRRPERSRVVLTFVTVFTNCAFVGYPIVESLFGAEGVFYTSIYNFVFSFFLWTYGQILFTGRQEPRQLVRSLFNAATVSILFGLVLLLTPLQLPPLGTRIVTLVGSATTPLAMIVIGAMLAEVRLRDMLRSWSVFFVTALRLILLPLATFAIMRLLGADPRVTAICTILTGLPAASNAVIFANKFDGDALLATRIVVITTALSMLSIPLLAYLVQ